MTLDEFDRQFAGMKQQDKVAVPCDHPLHTGATKPLGREAARRNIRGNGGERFICRQCFLKHKNPMHGHGSGYKPDDLVQVTCPDPLHDEAKKPRTRPMPWSSFTGARQEPYQQVCKTCAQRGKEISQEQRAAISKKLTGRKLSPIHKERILAYRKNNPEWAAQSRRNLRPELGRGWNKGIATPQNVKDKISDSNTGKVRTPKQRDNVSKGRLLWLKRVGGFTREHKEAIGRATVRQWARGFDANVHHKRGWHESPKAGRLFHRSSYEAKAYLILDADPDVISYSVEAVTIPYFNPDKQITSTYLVDALVTRTTGWQLLEMKPLKRVTSPVNEAKIKAALVYAEKRGWDFRVWTEIDLFKDEKEMRAFAASL